MNYKEFVYTMRDAVKEEISDHCKVEVHTVRKNNGKDKVGLVIIQRGIDISPTIYLEEFYEKYLNGEDVTDLAHSICEIYSHIKFEEPYPYQNLLQFEFVKERIVYKIIHHKMNEILLKDVPFVEYLDLAIVFYVVLENTEHGIATMLIRNEHLERWGVKKEEVAHLAAENTPDLLPAEMMQMTDEMYVLTNENRNLGASVILYPELLTNMGKYLRNNFYVLPSSIHEVILIPESFELDAVKLTKMVREVNRTEVDPEEILSDHVYYFDREQDILELKL